MNGGAYVLPPAQSAGEFRRAAVEPFIAPRCGILPGHPLRFGPNSGAVSGGGHQVWSRLAGFHDFAGHICTSSVNGSGHSGRTDRPKASDEHVHCQGAPLEKGVRSGWAAYACWSIVRILLLSNPPYHIRRKPVKRTAWGDSAAGQNYTKENSHSLKVTRR